MPAPLPVAVDVDGTSGRWAVDGVPMILVPQHLITGVLTTAEQHAGTSGTAGALRTAGRLAARRWCEHQADHCDLSGADLVLHYLEQLGRRGWGRFTVLELDLATSHLDVRVDHSAFATRQLAAPATGACYPFASWLEGAVAYAGNRSADLRVTENQCVAAGADHCRFRSLPD